MGACSVVGGERDGILENKTHSPMFLEEVPSTVISLSHHSPPTLTPPPFTEKMPLQLVLWLQQWTKSASV